MHTLNKIFCIGILALILSCQENPMIVEQLDDGAYYQYQINPQDSSKHGKYEAFDAKGQLIERSIYADGYLQGQRIIYDSLGNKEVVEHHHQGLFVGDYTVYFSNGTPQLTGQYLDNQMTGQWNRYYDDGQLMESVTFTSNEENGPFIEYHPNGHLKAEGNYLNGDNEDGELKLYNVDGVLERKMNCVAGRCSTTWKLNNDVQ